MNEMDIWTFTTPEQARSVIAILQLKDVELAPLQVLDECANLVQGWGIMRGGEDSQIFLHMDGKLHGIGRDYYQSRQKVEDVEK